MTPARLPAIAAGYAYSVTNPKGKPQRPRRERREAVACSARRKAGRRQDGAKLFRSIGPGRIDGASGVIATTARGW